MRIILVILLGILSHNCLAENITTPVSTQHELPISAGGLRYTATVGLLPIYDNIPNGNESAKLSSC